MGRAALSLLSSDGLGYPGRENDLTEKNLVRRKRKWISLNNWKKLVKLNYRVTGTQKIKPKPELNPSVALFLSLANIADNIGSSSSMDGVHYCKIIAIEFSIHCINDGLQNTTKLDKNSNKKSLPSSSDCISLYNM